MTSFFRKKVYPTEVGEQLCARAREDRDEGYPQTSSVLVPSAKIDLETVKTEWLYLEIFNIDLAVRHAFGRSTETSAILAAFWSAVKGWLQPEIVGLLPERRVLLDGYSKVLPPENKEDSYSRLKRRLQLYGECSHAKHALCDDSWIAATFLGLCGTPGGTSLADIMSILASRRDEIAASLKSQRIIVCG